MLYLLNKDVRTVRWNGEPLHETTSAIVKETMNGDFTLTVKYPISDSGIYQLIKEDMLIKAPTPVLGAQLFRIKKPVEHNNHLEITAYHISDDVMQRSITPVSVTSQSCGMALSRMVQNTKTALGDFSFNSDIQDRRTFNTTETETLYSVLLDGKHSIVGTWEGELVRDNFALTVKKSRGENRGVVITTHKNLKDYQRTRNSQNVVTRIHAKSTFKPEGAEKETTIRVIVDSPLINSYPYINEKEYENNNAKSVEELQKWAQAKFSNEGIDKVSDAIKIEAYELDGQVVHMGDTVNLKSWKHNVDLFKKAVAYEFDALKEEYISLTFDDKAGTGGSRTSGGLSSAADAILGVTESAQEIALEKALQNADLYFDHKAGLLRQEISDGIELAKARAEEVKRELSNTIDQRFSSFNNGPLQEAKRRAEEALRNAGASSLLAQEAKRIGLDSVTKLEEFKKQATSAQTALSGDLDVLKRTIANDIRPKQEQVTSEIAKQVKALGQTRDELLGIKSAQATYEETTTRRLSELTNLANGKASKSELVQTAEELKSKIASVQIGGRNYIRNGQFKNGSKNWIEYQSVNFDLNFNYQHSKNPDNRNRPGLHFYHESQDVANFFGIQQSFAFEGVRGEKVSVSLLVSKDGGDSNSGLRVALHYIKNKNIIGQEWQSIPSPQITSKYKRFTFTFTLSDDVENLNLMLYGEKGKTINLYVTDVQLERGSVATDYKEAPEDTENQISAVESSFKQRADSLEAGVNRLTEGLRTKADISSLNVTAENIRQSVKQIETDTQNKLNQKLSLAEFEVQAGSIRQEILNATKDKADKTLVVAEAGKLREELASLSVGGVNLLKKTKTFSGVNGKSQLLSETYNNCAIRYFKNADANSAYQDIVAYYDALYPELFGTYTLSFWAKGTGEMTTFFYGRSGFLPVVYGKTSQGLVSKAGDGNCRFTLSADWQRYYVVYKLADAPAEATSIYKHVLFRHISRSTTDEVWLAGVKLERGNLATDYSDSPEDTEGVITEAKATFERTAQGLRTDLSAIQAYVNKDGQRQEALQRYTREESARQATSIRELVARDFVGKASYQEDVRGIERRLSAISTQTNNDIATKIAQYKQTVDGQFASITSQIANKANQTDFQRVRETSQLYERILGNSENGIADKVARMAMTSQLFQVEVAKNVGDGRNYVKNADFREGSKNWKETNISGLNFNYEHSLKTRGKTGIHIYGSAGKTEFYGIHQTYKFEGSKNDNVIVSFLASKDGANDFSGIRIGVHCRKNNAIISQMWRTIPNSEITGYSYKKIILTFNLPVDVDELNLMIFGERDKTINLYISEIKFEKGSTATSFTLAPEDTDEAIRSVQTQLAGSWSVQNINSAGDLISGINLGADGRNRVIGKSFHITGETLIDDAVIKSAMVDKLKTANFEAGSVTTVVLDAEAVTAEKLKVDQAFFNKLVANETYLSQLFAKQAFINRVQSVAIDASQVRSGILSGDRIYGGTIRGANIFGGTLTGHTKIQLGSYGSFDALDGGLQINVPRTINSKDGLGVQFIGSYGRGENVPYGLFLYRDSDFTIGNTATDTDEFLMTVQGYINAKGIGWLKTGKGSVNGKTTGTIGLWNSDNVSLSFGGSGNDIYYSYNSTAYSLWSVVNQHFSDRRLKENIVDCKHKALDYIHQFQFKEYDWKKQEDRPQQAHTKIGLIAQEVQALDPTLVYENGDTLNLDNLRLTNIALKAIQELALENQKLTHRLENLENERRTA